MAALNIRGLSDQEHEALRVAAALAGESMDVYAASAIREKILRDARGPKGASLAALLDGQARKAK